MEAKQRGKDYYLDGRNVTAKKGKRNRGNDTQSPHSHSTSLNHHKYEKEVTFEEQITTKKMPLSSKKMKMMIRCMQQYCSQEKDSCQQVYRRYQLTAKLFQQLQANFRLVGNEKEVQRNQKLMEQLTPPSEIRCEYCELLGHRCDKWQLQLLERGLLDDIACLQDELLKQCERKQELEQMLKIRDEVQDRVRQLQNLKEIQRDQNKMLIQLSQCLQGAGQVKRCFRKYRGCQQIVNDVS